jgi:hypothetical protein
MWTGTVDSIHIAPAAKAPTQAVDAVEAVPGAGLKGDRYFLKQGTFFKPEPDFELTLIEAEAIEAAMREYKVALPPGEARQLGDARCPVEPFGGTRFRNRRCQGSRNSLVQACGHLEALTGLRSSNPAKYRGGLRAQILTQGVIRVGDGARIDHDGPNLSLASAEGAHADPRSSRTFRHRSQTGS